jgi:hypothetical protein
MTPRDEIHLTEDQINHIADKAAEKALKLVYEQVGKSVMTKIFWIAGVVIVSLMIWLAGKGAIVQPPT